jgi:hypothetical protein
MPCTTLEERLMEARMHRELSRANVMIRGRGALMETVEEKLQEPAVSWRLPVWPPDYRHGDS